MTARDPVALGNLADSLVWPAIDLVGLVRGGLGDHEAVGELLAGLTGDQRRALPVVLAAMVDDGKTPDELLSWVTFDCTGHPLREPRRVGPRWQTTVQCGTAGAYARHIVLRQDPDEACERAETARLAMRKVTNSRSARKVAAEAREREAGAAA